MTSYTVNSSSPIVVLCNTTLQPVDGASLTCGIRREVQALEEICFLLSNFAEFKKICIAFLETRDNCNHCCFTEGHKKDHNPQFSSNY